MKITAILLLLLYISSQASVFKINKNQNETPGNPKIEFSTEDEIILGDPVSIKITELSPNNKYKLVTEISDEWGIKFQSQVSFISDEHGIIDLSQDAPIDGDYNVVDGDGVFWSSKTVGEVPRIERTADPQKFSTADFKLYYNDEIIITRQLKRWLIKPGVKLTKINENGLVATLFQPETKEKHPGIIIVGGSGGGIMWQKLMAGPLASKGYTALALAYFKMEGLPTVLDRYPLEYFQKAIDFLKKLPNVDPERIIVVGQSVGGELALVLGAYLPDIKGVVAYAPSYVVFQSFAPPDYPETSKWSINGKGLPFVPFIGYDRNKTSVENWNNYLKNYEAVEKARIPVENTNGPILILTGKSDQIWDSSTMGDEIIKSLDKNDFPYFYKHYAYENAGHALARLGYVGTAETVTRNNNGGKAQGTSFAQADSWQQLLNFLETKIGKK